MKHRSFKFYIVIAMIMVAVVGYIVHAVKRYDYSQRHDRYMIEAHEAKQAGYEEAYTVCSREENVVIDGIEYLHFHAFRQVMIDGNYSEHLLASKDKAFLDKAIGQDEQLIVFGKRKGSCEVDQGDYYTMIEIYSVCNYELGKADDTLFDSIRCEVVSILIELVLGILLIISMILSFGRWIIHKWKK